LINETTTTLSKDIEITCKGFPDQISAEAVIYGFRRLAHEFGKKIDLKILSGVTIAYGDEDYKAAIKEVNADFFPSEGDAIGGAMTIGKLSSSGVASKHIVFRGCLFRPFFATNEEFIGEVSSYDSVEFMIHSVVHEFFHVETSVKFQKWFPYESFQKIFSNKLEQYHAVFAHSCWDEYLVCYLSAGYGGDPLDGYLSILDLQIKKIDERVIENFKKSIYSNNYNQLMYGTYDLCADLMKISCYCIGTLKASDSSIDLAPIKRIP
jgi:hypothetical protein